MAGMLYYCVDSCSLVAMGAVVGAWIGTGAGSYGRELVRLLTFHRGK